MCCNIKSFCGLSLRASAVIIGWVSAVISLLQSILYIACLANMDGIMNIVQNITGLKDSTQLDAIRTVICVVIPVRLGTSLLDSVTSILLIIATQQNSHLLLLPWLINNILDLVLKMVLILLAMILMQQLLPILPLVIWGIQCYAWIAIRSHYQNTRGRSGEEHMYLK